jgi:hypothetical protein
MQIVTLADGVLSNDEFDTAEFFKIQRFEWLRDSCMREYSSCGKRADWYGSAAAEPDAS